MPSRVDSPWTGRQSYVERAPLAALAGLVSSVWVQEVAPDTGPYVHRNVPNGGVEILCPAGDVPRVVGPLTRPLVDVLAPGTTVVGVRLHAGAAASLLGVPLSEVVDVTVDPEDLWGRSAAALGELVDVAASPQAAVARLERHVASRVVHAAPPDPLVSEVVRRLRWGSDDIGSIRSELYISERQLRRRCLAAIGIAPKTLHRMLRFQRFLAFAQHAVAQGRAPTADGLASLAAEAGYADQPHLSRECLRMTGLSPRTFLAEVEHNCGQEHDHAASFAPLLRSRPMAGLFKPGAGVPPYGRAHVHLARHRDAHRGRAR